MFVPAMPIEGDQEISSHSTATRGCLHLPKVWEEISRNVKLLLSCAWGRQVLSLISCHGFDMSVKNFEATVSNLEITGNPSRHSTSILCRRSNQNWLSKSHHNLKDNLWTLVTVHWIWMHYFIKTQSLFNGVNEISALKGWKLGIHVTSLSSLSLLSLKCIRKLD
jgi:hypothetical protein